MNQVYQLERCELHGGMDNGMKVMEAFVVSVSRSLLQQFGDLIRSVAGNTDHVTNLLQFTKVPEVRFPSITF